MEIKATNPSGTSTENDGIIIPNITRQRAQNMDNPSESSLIYISEAITGTASGKAIDINEKGYYYYNGTKWVKITTWDNINGPTHTFTNAIAHDQITNLVKLGGNLTEPTTINTNQANTLGITGNFINAFSVDGTTFSVDGENNRIGIGTATPTQALDVIGKAKITDANSTVASPALDIAGKIKITDGTQGVDKFLTSDANGVANWMALNSAKNIVTGTFTGNYITTDTTSTTRYTNTSINLTKERWIIFVGITLDYLENNKKWIHFYISSSTSSLLRNNFNFIGPASMIAGKIIGYDNDTVGNFNLNMITGSNIVDITSESLTLYLLIENKFNNVQFNPSAFENYFYAVPIN